MKSPRFAPLGPVAVAVVVYLFAFGAAMGALQAAPDLGTALLCAAPACAAALLAFSSQADRQQYVARLMAAALMLPIGLLMVLGGGSALPATIALVAAHGLAFVAGVFWLASATTRVMPARGTPRLTVQALLARIEALPFVCARDGSTCVVDHGFEDRETRSHRVLLDFDAARGTVYVREQVGAQAARPRDADEASMRSGGDAAFDPARPAAQRIWLRRWQASIIEPQTLAAAAPARDADGAVAQLCALVLRSGWVWQPVLVKRR